MMTFQWLSISMILIILLSTKIDASRYRSIRQTKVDLCPNPNGNACIFIECENGGECQEDPTTVECFKCQCSPGFTGKVCQTPVVILPTGCNPGCQNNGICSGNICVCPNGYTGQFCEIRDFCVPNNPCQNGGQCISTGANYLCDCTDTGYTGTTCTDLITTNLCAPNPCQNGGQCSSNGGTVNCLCVNGYTGAFCQIAPIPCVATPCQNDGVCQLTASNTYACVCKEDYTGSQCETSVVATHPCVTMPGICQNSGTCTINGAGYLCRCAIGWSGTNCQTPDTITSCTQNPCGAHGVCIQAIAPNGPVVFCNCEDRWTGKFCDINMDVNCPIGFCRNGGICRLNGNTPICDCPPTHTGQQCETAIIDPIITTTPMTTPTMLTTTTGSTMRPPTGDCSSRPCLNGGSCYNNGNSFICVCTSQFTGPTCNAIKNPTTTMTTILPGTNACSPNPCSNGGRCYKNGNGFVCVCTSQFTGATCATPKPTTMTTSTAPGSTATCTDMPCQNGGTCFNSGNSYFCYCGTNSNFTGKNCEISNTATTTTPAVANCMLNCAPGVCVATGNAQNPHACMCNGIINPTSCVSK
jgi:Notch-like protein